MNNQENLVILVLEKKEQVQTSIAFLSNKVQILMKMMKIRIWIWIIKKLKKFLQWKRLNIMLVDGNPTNMISFFKLSVSMEKTGT